MKKKCFSAVLLILMVMSIMLFATGCGSDNDAAAEYEAKIAELEAENAALQNEINKLLAEHNQAPQTAALQDWTMDAQAWSDGNGATVTFTGTPTDFIDGMKAALSVRMGDLEAESSNCVWDGSAFTCSVDLSAADGYSYYCVLTGADGTQTETELNAPDNITDETLVNLGSSLSAYANLVVENWEAADSSLNVKSGYIQAQMPRLTYQDSAPHVSGAVLILKLNNEEIGRQDVTLSAGEGLGSFETAVSDLSFSMPAMEEDYQLDLWLEVTLDSGYTISAAGGSWYSSDGELQLVVG